MSDNLDFAFARVNEFARNATDTPWGLNKASVLARVRQLLKNPDLFDQKGLDAAAQAVFFRIWFERDPISAATFACNLLQLGTAELGTLRVAAAPTLLAQQHTVLQAAHPQSTPADADWMLLSALQSSQSHEAGAVTPPNTLISWLSDVGLYSSIQDDTTVDRNLERDSLATLFGADNQDVILFIHSRAIDGGFASRPTCAPPNAERQASPNHYILARAAVFDDPRWLVLSYWSSAEHKRRWLGADRFFENYFGYILATI